MKKVLFLLIAVCAANAVASWRDTIRDEEVIICKGSFETNEFTFTAPPTDVPYIVEHDLREDSCEVVHTFHGDRDLGIKAYTKPMEKRAPDVCWKAIARLQLDGADCCFKNEDGTLAKPWMQCGVKGSRGRERAAKDKYIKRKIKELKDKGVSF